MRTTPLACGALAIAASMLTACGAGPGGAPSTPSTESAPAAAPPIEAPAEHAEHADAEPIVPPAAEAAPAPASSAVAAPAAPPPLSKEEQEVLAKRCKPLTQAMQRAAQKKSARGASPLDLLEALRKDPPKMPPEDLATCAGLMERSIRDYLAAAIQTEATVMLKMLSSSMIAHYEDTKQLCPPSASPVPKGDPAGLAEHPFVSAASDWAAPTWTCLHFELTGQSQRFQYEVRTDPNGKWFEIVARGAPRRDGHIVEIVQRGDINEKGIALTSPHGSR
jgi:hypothetical protein